MPKNSSEIMNTTSTVSPNSTTSTLLSLLTTISTYSTKFAIPSGHLESTTSPPITLESPQLENVSAKTPLAVKVHELEHFYLFIGIGCIACAIIIYFVMYSYSHK